MHSLKQNCGSFQWESLQQQWLTDKEREQLQERDRNSKLAPVDSWSSSSAQKLREMAKPLSSSAQGPPYDDSKRLSVAFGDDAKVLTAAAPPVESVISVQCAPKEWPLFDTPNLSSLRVTGFKEKGGTVVSII